MSKAREVKMCKQEWRDADVIGPEGKSGDPHLSIVPKVSKNEWV